MVEPSTSAGITLTVISVAILGPLVGPYALIVFAALAGAMWPLSASQTETRLSGFWLLLRCTLTAVVLTAFLARLLDRLWAIPVNESLAPVAMFIGALGNGWRPVFDAIGGAARALLGKAGGNQQ